MILTFSYPKPAFWNKIRVRLLISFFLVGKNQGLEQISDLIILLASGGFFRDNGLNSLPSIRHIGSLLNDSNVLKNVEVKIETVVSFVRKSKFLR